MIKVLHFCSDTNIGGAGITLFRLLQSSDKSKFEHYVALPKGSLVSSYAEMTGVTVVFYSSAPNRSFSFGAVFEFKRLIKHLSPDIVHTHGAFSARIAAALCGVRSRIYTRHTYSEKKYSLISQFVNNIITTKAVAVNEVLVDQMVNSGINKNKIVVIENGCDSFLCDDSVDFRSNQKKDTFNILYHGRIVKEKGLDVAVTAISKLVFPDSGLKLIIVGEGEYKEELIKTVAKLSISDKVEFVPFTRDVRELFHRADAVINCSINAEGTSNSLIEAMSAAKPIIASNIGGNKNLVSHEQNGLLFSSNDIDSFCMCMSRLLKEKDLYQKLSEGAFFTYKKRFTLDKMNNGYENLWKEEYKRYYEGE